MKQSPHRVARPGSARGAILVRQGKSGKRREAGMDRRGTGALRHVAAVARRRFAPPAPPRHAVEMARDGVPPVVIQRQLGHANLGITLVYLQCIDNAEIITPSTPGPLR